jgi:hypothetical protein
MTAVHATERRANRRAEAAREIAVLANGPWARHQYWRADLEAMQAASRAIGYPDDHPSAVLRHYHPTDDYHPGARPDQHQRLWRYRAPATPSATAAATPTRCHDPQQEDRMNPALTGTSLQGLVEARFAHVLAAFGTPSEPFDPDKTHVEWVIQTPHGVAAIYDYGDCHDCESGCDRDPRNWQTDMPWSWHIGGHDPGVATWVRAVLEGFALPTSAGMEPAGATADRGAAR